MIHKKNIISATTGSKKTYDTILNAETYFEQYPTKNSASKFLQKKIHTETSEFSKKKKCAH